MSEVWQTDIPNSLMFKFVSKLKLLKNHLKDLNKKKFWNISKNVKEARRQLNEVQDKLNSRSLHISFRQEEKKKVCLFSLSKKKFKTIEIVKKILRSLLDS